jgi:hypothetical protein
MAQVINVGLSLFYDDIKGYSYLDEMETEQFFVQNDPYSYHISAWKNLPPVTTRSILSFYNQVDEPYYATFEENLRLEENITKITSFIESQKIVFLENKKDFTNCLKNLSLEEIESLLHFLINIVHFLNNNKRKATIYVHDDQICIYVFFKTNESNYKIDEIINKIYDLVEQKGLFTFVNIGEDFEE